MKKGLRFMKDTFLGVVGLVFMNAVLSVLVYPFLKDRFVLEFGETLGAELHGKVLFYTSIMNLLAGTFGSAANYARLKVLSQEKKTVNGDYNVFLMISFLFVAVLTIIAALVKGDSANTSIVLIIILIFATVVRYYADVEFRLTLRYGHFCLYYVVIGAGYLLGMLLFTWTKNWVLVFLPGEFFGLIYVMIFGRVLRRPVLETSPDYKKHLGIMASLALAFFLSDFVGQSDRLLFPLILPEGGDAMTSLYYSASLVGKMMSLLSTPLNGVLMGHLSNEDGEISRKNFVKIILLMIAVFVLVTVVAVVGSHIFVLWRYPDNYEAVKDLFILANAGQVLFFVCNTLSVIVLRYTHPRNQMIASGAYIVAFFAITVPLIKVFGIYGMAYGILIVNTLKFVLFAILGIVGVKKQPQAAKTEE